METKFNSQICTTREQSERLLALGLKKETADMCWIPLSDGRCVLGVSTEIRLDTIPAWSLHRLWELGNFKHIILDSEDEMPQIYEFAIDNIEKQIKQKSLNKEYLVDQEAIEEHCKGVMEYLDYIREED